MLEMVVSIVSEKQTATTDDGGWTDAGRDWRGTGVDVQIHLGEFGSSTTNRDHPVR